MTDFLKAVIVTAIKEELAAVTSAIPKAGQHAAHLIRGGAGWSSATRAARDIATRQPAPQWICSTGFSGGLADGLNVGDIVLATELWGDQEAAITCLTPSRIELLSHALTAAKIRFHAGATVTVTGAVTRTEDKRALGIKRNAIAVDMESYALISTYQKMAAAPARAFVMRVISDSVDDALPPEIAEFLDEKGNVRMGKVARFMLGGPRHVKTLMELKARSDKAAAALTAAWKAVWPLLTGLA